MKLLVKAALFLAWLAAFVPTMSFAQLPVSTPPAEFRAVDYSTYVLRINSGPSTTGSVTYAVRAPQIVVKGRNVFPLNVNNPIQIDQETVTPTAVSGCNAVAPPNNLCQITVSVSTAHGAGSTIQSSTVGLQEAINDAAGAIGGSTIGCSTNLTVGGAVLVDDAWAQRGGTNTILGAAVPYPCVMITSNREGAYAKWGAQPKTLTALATPATRAASASGCDATHFVCDGTAVGTWTNAATYVCVTYVDILGGESPCSTTSNYTSAGSLAINFTAPVASTGAVGWRAYAGASYATAYQIPITSSTCTLTTLESVIPACAVANATYGQSASNGVFPTPYVHSQIPPQAGGVAAQYNPNTQSHTLFAYQPVANYATFQQNYGPFVVSPALTGGQLVVLGTVPLPAGMLNFIGRTLHISGDITLTPSTGGTINPIVALGDITDFTTGTPVTECNLAETTASGTAAIKVHIDCTLTTNATGTTGSIMPGGFLLEQLQAGTTTGNLGVETATAAVTSDVQNQDSIFIVWKQTTAAESTTPPQLLDLHIEVI